nr:hypothetical protein [uncultured Actinoplanes sp.]
MDIKSLLTESAGQIAGAVTIAILAFTLGSFRRVIVQRFRTRHTRKYWSPFKDKGLTIVLGSFSPSVSPPSDRHRAIDTSPLQDFEPYGLVGFGEVLALLNLQEHLKVLGMEDVTIAQPTDVRAMRSRHLVLVGGPDPNPVTDLAMQHGQLPVRFLEADNSRSQMHVTLGGKDESVPQELIYTPQFLPDHPGQLSRDYGFVAQVPSPYADRCVAILLVGVYGAGTVAAAQLVTSSYGVSRMRRVNQGRCLTVFRADVGRNGDISFPRIERCEKLDGEE